MNFNIFCIDLHRFTATAMMMAEEAATAVVDVDSSVDVVDE
jgi:hypothetical protein